MAKSIRSKSKRKMRALKRDTVFKPVETERLSKITENTSALEDKEEMIVEKNLDMAEAYSHISNSKVKALKKIRKFGRSKRIFTTFGSMKRKKNKKSIMVLTGAGGDVDVSFYEKETEFFSFTPIWLMDQILNSINERVYEAADKFQSALLENCTKQVNPDQIEHGMQQLITLMESCVDKYFTVFEEYVLSNVLRVPDETVLPHWRNLDEETRDVSDGVSEEIIAEWKQILALKGKNQKLERLNESFDHWIKQVTAVTQRLLQFQVMLQKHGVNDLSERVKAILLEELPKCIAKVEETYERSAKFI